MPWAGEVERQTPGTQAREGGGLSPVNGCASQQIRSRIDFVVNVQKIEDFTLNIQTSQFS